MAVEPSSVMSAAPTAVLIITALRAPKNVVTIFLQAVIASSLARSEQLLRCDPRAFDHGGELRPRHVRMNLIPRARRAEAAIGSGDDAFAPDRVGESDDALRHQLRMLHQVD